MSTASVAVIWIDWYAYHVARFAGLCSAPGLQGRVSGIELVGGVGVHAGLKFREDLPVDLPIETLMPECGWREAGQLRLSLKLWHALTRLHPKVLLVPGYYTLPAIAAALWCRLHGSTAVMMTESTADDHPRSAWKERLKSWLIRSLFDWAICGGAAHRRYLHMLGFPVDRIAKSYDVVDNDSFEARTVALRQHKRPQFLPENYFLYVGRLAPEKSVTTLVQCWIDYRAAGGTWSLVLVGDGPSAPELRLAANASKFGCDLLFAGLRTSSELPQFYAFAECFVLPSSREPWGLVVNEAMASGLPVLVSDRCGCAEDLVVNGTNGFTFDTSKPAQLTSQLHDLENMEPARRFAMGSSSGQLIRKYSPSAFGVEVSKIAHLCTPDDGNVTSARESIVSR